MTTVSRLLIGGSVLIGVAFWMNARMKRELAAEFGAPQRAAGQPAGSVAQAGSQSEAEEPLDGDRVLPEIGYRAPEMSALTIDGTEVQRQLRNYPNQVVVLYVWATWCGYCRDEMPSIEALHREFRTQGVYVLAVAVNGDDDLLRKTARERGFTFEVLRDDRKATAKSYVVTGYPRTVIIDRKGVIRGIQRGYHPDNHRENVALIRQILAE